MIACLLRKDRLSGQLYAPITHNEVKENNVDEKSIIEEKEEDDDKNSDSQQRKPVAQKGLDIVLD